MFIVIYHWGIGLMLWYRLRLVVLQLPVCRCTAERQCATVRQWFLHLAFWIVVHICIHMLAKLCVSTKYICEWPAWAVDGLAEMISSTITQCLHMKWSSPLILFVDGWQFTHDRKLVLICSYFNDCTNLERSKSFGRVMVSLDTFSNDSSISSRYCWLNDKKSSPPLSSSPTLPSFRCSSISQLSPSCEHGMWLLQQERSSANGCEQLLG